MPKYKLKGAFWSPDPLNYADSISQASPPCWYRDLGNIASARAAVAAMTQGIDPMLWLKCHSDPFDFMLRARANKSSTLLLDGQPVQSTCRYYVGIEGGSFVKTAPPAGPEGTFKRANGISEAEWLAVMQSNGWQWDERVCTKNKSRYEERRTAIEAGYKVALCNDAAEFRFSNINYNWYLAEAMKLIID